MIRSAGMAALVLLFAIPVAVAQEEEPPDDAIPEILADESQLADLSRLARAAFECSALVQLADYDGILEEGERLFLVGYNAMREYWPIRRAEAGEPDLIFGPEIAFLARMPDDFQIGGSYRGAIEDMIDFLDETYPDSMLVELGVDTWQGMRASLAEAEFYRRNCRVVGL